MRRLAVGCGLGLALATACGGSPSSDTAAPSGNASASTSASSSASTVDAAALVAAASTKTLAKATSRVATTVVSSTGLRLQSTGVYDYRRGDAVVDITTTVGGRTSKQHMVLVAGTAYLNVPGLGKERKYIKLDLSALTGQSGGSFDQSTQLSRLRGATDSLRKVGSEPVRGVPTTHVVGTLDQAKALAAITDAKQRTALQKLTSMVKTPNRIPVELWIDNDGVLRRQRQAVTVPAQKVGGAAVPASTVTTTAEFYDFGVPVKAVAPPARTIAS